MRGGSQRREGEPVRRHPPRSAIASIPIALLVVMAVASGVNAASVSWTTPVQLADHDSYLTDTAYAGDDMAVVWEEYGNGSRHAVVARTSGNEGVSFGAALHVGKARGGRVALCGKA